MIRLLSCRLLFVLRDLFAESTFFPLKQIAELQLSRLKNWWPSLWLGHVHLTLCTRVQWRSHCQGSGMRGAHSHFLVKSLTSKKVVMEFLHVHILSWILLPTPPQFFHGFAQFSWPVPARMGWPMPRDYCMPMFESGNKFNRVPWLNSSLYVQHVCLCFISCGWIMKRRSVNS